MGKLGVSCDDEFSTADAFVGSCFQTKRSAWGGLTLSDSEALAKMRNRCLRGAIDLVVSGRDWSGVLCQQRDIVELF